MKSVIKSLSLVVFLFIGSQKMTSQQVALNSNQNMQMSRLDAFNISEEEEYKSENAVLSEGKYTFDNGKKEVVVEIKDGYYTEHYANNEFIKAKIKWVSKNEYNLVITEIQKEGLPFEAGTKLNTKIFKVKGNRYYYESDLEGLTWTGKFIKE